MIENRKHFGCKGYKIFSLHLNMSKKLQLENGFEKRKHFTTCWLEAFSSDAPQSIKRQNKGPKEHDEKVRLG